MDCTQHHEWHLWCTPHLEAIPCVGTLSTGGLPRRDVQHLGRHAHRSLHLQLLVLGTTDQVGADCTSIGKVSNRELLKRSGAVPVLTAKKVQY